MLFRSSGIIGASGKGHSLRPIASHKPPSPSNTAVGPVNPSFASSAANTALRVALAPAEPFQLDKLPRRAYASAMFGVSASDNA